MTYPARLCSNNSIMAKVDIQLVEMVLKRAKVDTAQIAKILEDIKYETEAAKDTAEKEPAVKKQFVVIVNDPYGKIEETGFEYSGWVVQIPEDAAPQSALQKLHFGAYDFNITPKGRKMPIKTIDEAVRFGSAKIYKEHQIWLKNKEPVLIMTTNGKLPKAPKSEEEEF